MSKTVENGFMPLSQIEQREPGRVFVALDLPEYVDKDRIGINLPRIEGFCNLSGIEMLTILGDKGGPTSKESPTVAGINPDGSAIAGKKVEKTIVPASVGIQTPIYHNDMGRRSTIVTLGVNVDELTQRATQTDGGTRSTEVWSKNLDNAIKVPLRKVGTDNLINHWDTETKSFYFVLPAFLWIMNSIEFNGNPEYYLSQLVSFSLAYRGAEYFKHRKDPHFRPSLFVGPQIDRAAVLQVKSRRQKLVADLHPDKK